ncbi:MAG: hypothetical protein LBD37_04425 [Treponema sp.]|jgi:hypothetical protein|nr:hypothetical protein [Treponema sp.]
MLFYTLAALLVSCATESPAAPVPAAAIDAPGAGEFVLRVENPTRFNVYFERGQLVRKGSSAPVSLALEDAALTGGIDILYEIPLSGTVVLYCKGDHRTIRENQSSLTVTEPRITENYGTFIALTNRADNAISFYAGGTAEPSWEQKGSPAAGNHLTWTDKREFSRNETAVFSIRRDSGTDDFHIRDSRRNIPLRLPPLMAGNFLYSFEYNGSAAVLVDERPLRRVAESPWAKTIAGAEGLVWPAPGNEQSSFFAPAAQGLFRHDFDSAGSGGAPVFSGERFEIVHAGRTADGFMTAGYAQTGNTFRPIALIQGEDGAMRTELAPSTRRDRYSAYYLAAAAGGIDGPGGAGTWLLAGGADSGVNRPDGYRPYLRLVRRERGGLVPVWELGGDEFNAQPSGNQCGPITAAAYDPAHDRWLAAGNTLEWDRYGNSLGNSWLAGISANGTIQKIDRSFKGMTINKILTGAGGAYYLAGEERKGNESRGFCVKYASTGAELWRLASQPPPHSYVQDAVLDEAGQRLVLAGTLRAADPSGQGGIPFTLGLDAESGGLLWREELASPALNGAAVVTAIGPAPDYGYVLALAGVGDGNFARPFGIARINSRGKLDNAD